MSAQLQTAIALDPVGPSSQALNLEAADPAFVSFIASCPNSWAGDQGFLNWCQALYQHGQSSAPPPPTPQLDAISPANVPAGANSVLLTVTGTSFGDGATILCNGADAASPTNSLGLCALVPDALVAASGNVAVQVRTAAGTESNTLSLTVA